MTDSSMVSLLSDSELDAVTGGTGGVRIAASRTRVSVDQTVNGGFVGDFTLTASSSNVSLYGVGNTSNTSVVKVVTIA